MNVTLDHTEQITPTVCTFWFRPEQPVRYAAGQFTELYLPHDNADERGIRRWFTLSSSPTEELLGITTRIEPQHGSSYKQQMAALQPGANLQLAEPMGDFVLPKDPLIPLVFVAAGLGITPIRSMVKWLQDTGEQRNIHLLHAAQAGELAFNELFGRQDFTYQPIIHSPREHLAPKTIRNIAGNESLIYISGPEELVESLYKQLKGLGVNPGRLVADYFPGYRT